MPSTKQTNFLRSLIRSYTDTAARYGITMYGNVSDGISTILKFHPEGKYRPGTRNRKIAETLKSCDMSESRTFRFLRDAIGDYPLIWKGNNPVKGGPRVAKNVYEQRDDAIVTIGNIKREMLDAMRYTLPNAPDGDSGSDSGSGNDSPSGGESPTGDTDTPNGDSDSGSTDTGNGEGDTPSEGDTDSGTASSPFDYMVWGRANGAPENAHGVSPYVALCVKANIPTWLHGPAGTGKSSAARFAADAAGLDYYEVNLAGAMASAIKGRDRLNEFMRSEFTRAYENGGVIALEEFDAAHPSVAVAVNNAIAGDEFWNDAEGRMIPRHSEFRIIATANTVGTGAKDGFRGRNALDAATLDRFRAGMIYVGLDSDLENSIVDKKVNTADDSLSADIRKFQNRIWELRKFGTARDTDKMDSMRPMLDGVDMIVAGAPMAGVILSVTAAWQEDSRKQAGVHGIVR